MPATWVASSTSSTSSPAPLPGLAVVERERAEHRAVGREDRRRPAGLQARFERELAEVAPERIGRDVGDAHALAAEGGRAARSDARADRRPVDRLAVGRRQARSRAVPQVHAVARRAAGSRRARRRRAPRRSARGGRGRAAATAPPATNSSSSRLARGERLRALALGDVARDRGGADDGRRRRRRSARSSTRRRSACRPCGCRRPRSARPPRRGVSRSFDVVRMHAAVRAARGSPRRPTRISLGGVAEDALGSRVPARDDAVDGAADDRVERRSDDGLALEQRRLALLLVGDVAHVHGVQRVSGHVDLGDAELEGELAAVRTHPHGLDALDLISTRRSPPGSAGSRAHASCEPPAARSGRPSAGRERRPAHSRRCSRQRD